MKHVYAMIRKEVSAMAVDEHQELREIIRETIIHTAERAVAQMIIQRAIEQMAQRKKQAINNLHNPL